MITLLNYTNFLSITSVWFNFIIDMTIKGTLILGAAYIVVLIWKNETAAARHFVWSLAIISILIMPLLSVVIPTFDIALFTSVPQSKQYISLDNNLELRNNSLSTSVNSTKTGPVYLNNRGIFSYAVSVIQTTLNRLHWSVWLLMLWFMGALFIFVRMLIGLMEINRMIKYAAPVQSRTLKSIAALCTNRIGVKRNIRLLQSKGTEVPLAWGWFRPVIVVPDKAEFWTEKQKKIVLMHELAHIKRGDIFITMLAYTASVMYWFNPLVWTALRQLYIEREYACDEYVVAAGTKASEYACHLLEIAQMLTAVKRPSPIGVAMVRKSHLKKRLMTILDNKHRTCLKPLTRLLIGILAVSFLTPLASVQIRAQKQNSIGAESINTDEQNLPQQVKHDIYQVIFVNTLTGNDETGNGTKDRPFKSVDRALAGSSLDEIIIKYERKNKNIIEIIPYRPELYDHNTLGKSVEMFRVSNTRMDSTTKKTKTFYKPKQDIIEGKIWFRELIYKISQELDAENKDMSIQEKNLKRTVNFEFSEDISARFFVENLLGDIIRRYPYRMCPKGRVTFTWDGKDDNGRTIFSGIYFIAMDATEDIYDVQKIEHIK